MMSESECMYSFTLPSRRKSSGGCFKKKNASVSSPQLTPFLEYIYTELMNPHYPEVNLASCLI